jgi:hypothetical protein
MGKEKKSPKCNPGGNIYSNCFLGTTDIVTLFVTPKITFSFKLGSFQSSQNRKHLEDKRFIHERQKGNRMECQNKAMPKEYCEDKMK